MTQSFLLCGLGWQEFYKTVPPERAAEAEKNIRAGLAQTKDKFEKAGLDYEQINYEPGEDMARWREIISTKKWDGILIGGGIRAGYPELLEDLVNNVVEKSPHSRVLFNTKPDNAFEAVQRAFGVRQ